MNHLRSRIKGLAVPALVLPFLPLTAIAAMAPASSAAPHAPRASAVAPDAAWSPTSVSQRSLRGEDVRVKPSRAAAYTLDTNALDGLLDRAPSESASTRGSLLSVPAPNGDMVQFRIVDSPIMEAGLAAKHPEIRTYAGRAVSSPATIRLDVTRTGFHASVRGAGATWYVDPQVNGPQDADSVYLSYRGADLPAKDKPLVEPDLGDLDSKIAKRAGETTPGDAVIHRTYRLALVSDPSYARYFGSANVLSEKVTLMNRVNQIYNDDLAIKMVMIDATDKLNLDTTEAAFGPDGDCGSAGCFLPNQFDGGCVGSLLNRNLFALGEMVGPENYDIGHIMLGINGGGVAGLGVVGGNGKARGCTGLPQPEGDFMAIDYVAHEMGHQFGGNHTFNGTQYNCGGNKAAPSVEPGSGSSVMAYAGICQQDNLQPHSDPYFSQWTQQEVSTYITSTPTVNEVQSVTLDNFDTDGESFTLTFNGQTTAPITRGVDYTTTAIRTAINAIVPPGGTVSVSALGGSGSLTDKGFQITFGGGATNNLAGVDQESVVLNPSEGVTGHVTETTKGGMRTNGGNEVTTTENHTPVVTTPGTKTIPTRTPFALTGEATDSDGDHMLYQWEQADRGAGTGTALVSQTKTNGPLFRVFGTYADVTPAATLLIDSEGENHADDNPTRVFPDMEQILANNTNAETGKCPDAPAAPATGGATNVPVSTIDCFSEWLPTADYVGSTQANNQEPSLNFRFTARDLDPEAGGYGFGNTKVVIAPTAGPFLVSSKNAPAAAVGGRSESVNWAVAGTNTPEMAENVKISLSTDGGHTFPTTLVESTPNDGSEPVVWPNVATDHARIKIEAVDNVFFDVNNADFQIVKREVPDTTIVSGPADNSVLLAHATDIELSSVDGATYDCTFDGDPVDCADGTASLTDIAAGTHVFEATASKSGLTDESPATLTFTVPRDDRDLTRAGSWSDVASQDAFEGTLSKAAKKGASLTTAIDNATALYLVAPQGPKLGKVSVLLNGELLKNVALRSATRSEQNVLPIVESGDAMTGNLVIRTVNGKQVRIDGLAVVAGPVTQN